MGPSRGNEGRREGVDKAARGRRRLWYANQDGVLYSTKLHRLVQEQMKRDMFIIVCRWLIPATCIDTQVACQDGCRVQLVIVEDGTDVPIQKNEHLD